jgi:hypothetical protein
MSADEPFGFPGHFFPRIADLSFDEIHDFSFQPYPVEDLIE